MSSNKLVIANKFYKHLKEFMKDLINVFPDDREIKVISSSINIASMDDEDNDLIYSFRDALYPLDKFIVSRDDNLFKQDPSIYWKTGSNQYQLFDKLNIYWESLNDINKKIVWDYIQLVYSLAIQF
jgi:hypothetical protein